MDVPDYDIEDYDMKELTAYQIGRYHEIVILAMTAPDTRTEELKIAYSNNQAYAKWYLGVDFPDQPPIETTTDHEMEQFFQNHIHYFRNYVYQHKNNRIQYYYSAGRCVAKIVYLILAYNHPNHRNEDISKILEEQVQALNLWAKALGADISDELSLIDNHELLDGDDTTKLQQAITSKLVAPRVLQKRSEIDRTRIITDKHWVISLVRLPERSNNEHAFLVVEGKTRNKSFIWFVDFVVANDASDLVRPGARDGKVRTDYHETEVVGPSSKLLFQCRKKMMEISARDRLLYSTWLISKPMAETLIENIKTQQNNPPKYNILGDSALGRSTAAVKRTTVGHNCFTFARKLLRDLDDEHIHLPEDTLGEWLVYATSRNLVDTKFNKQWWEATKYPLILTFLAGIAVTFLFGVVLNWLKRL